MAIDTASKRSSALDFEEVWQAGVPLPDGAISQADRQHLAYSYSGILATTADVYVKALHLWPMSAALTFETQSAALTVHDATGVLTTENDA